jgi:hypothetical protein
MATIDIPLPDELTQALQPPVCLNLQLPKPDMPSLTLPIGGTLQGVADITRGIPTDCSMRFSLMLQLAPIMASMQCLLKILQFFADLVNVSPSNPVSFLTALVDGIKALEECTNMVLPSGLLCFVKDLLALIARMLLCTVEALESVLKLLGGLQLQIADAQASGNAELLAALQCAQQNAMNAADGTMQALQPVGVLLVLAQPFMKITGTNLSVGIPSPVPADDLEAMQTLLQTLHTVAEAIKTVADGIPC